MTIFWIAVIAFDVAIGIKIFQNYGDMKFLKGKASAYAEFDKLIKDINKNYGNTMPTLSKDIQKDKKGVVSTKRAE